MIYVSSDWHALSDTIEKQIGQFSFLTGEDSLILLGDLSNDWSLRKEVPWFLEWIEKLPCLVFLIDGNHDDIEYLDRLEETLIAGARGHLLGKNLFHIKRGEVLTLEGLKILTLGGGFSGDGYRSRHPGEWQERELPELSEMGNMLDSCMKYGWSFDYILSHAAPLSVMKEYQLGEEFCPYQAFLDGIARNADFRHWYFGHHHRQECFGKYEVIYRDAVRL